LPADNFEDANGSTILAYHEAVDRARQIARGSGEVDSVGRPATLAEALDRYEAELKARGGCLKNVTRVRANLPCACEISPQFGLLVEVLAITGARISQAGRLVIGDLQTDPTV
jgi:hypothetical protein